MGPRNSTDWVNFWSALTLTIPGKFSHISWSCLGVFVFFNHTSVETRASKTNFCLSCVIFQETTQTWIVWGHLFELRDFASKNIGLMDFLTYINTNLTSRKQLRMKNKVRVFNMTVALKVRWSAKTDSCQSKFVRCQNTQSEIKIPYL